MKSLLLAGSALSIIPQNLALAYAFLSHGAATPLLPSVNQGVAMWKLVYTGLWREPLSQPGARLAMFIMKIGATTTITFTILLG